MVSKKELTKKIERLERQLEMYHSTDWTEYLFLTVDIGNRLNPEAESKTIETIRTQVGAEFVRFGIKAKPIILTDKVKSIYPHSEQRVKE